MIPIVSVVGKSDSGKTTLIEKLVPELTRRGYRVATVKHDMHGFEVDREGKDSWRHKQAGAHTVVIASPQKIALIRDVERDLTLDEISSARSPRSRESRRAALPKARPRSTRSRPQSFAKCWACPDSAPRRRSRSASTGPVFPSVWFGRPPAATLSSSRPAACAVGSSSP